MNEINYLAVAEIALQSAKTLYNSNDYNGAVDRAYYAMHNAATHILLNAGLKIPKTHHGLHTLFSQHFILSGFLPKQLSTIISHVENVRLKADYSGEFQSEGNAENCISKAEEFLKAIKEFLAKS